ncbi:MAG: PQQ-dependent catabolism-associated beta-propeller protein [Gammaproteobacteria bacterium]|nr:PQQ-dependent catabolism-associated beta-propeller protein [Gammaproteobacteria bacterium]
MRRPDVIKPVTILAAVLFAATAAAAPSNRVFVTNERGDSVTVIDAATNQVVGTIDVGKRPRGIGIAPDGSEIYVALAAENAIAVIDPVAMEVVRKFPSGDDPEAFAVNTNGYLYISNEDDAKASVYNPADGSLVAEIKVGIEPEGVAASPDGSKVVVTSESTNMLHVISVPQHRIEANILVGARPRSAAFSPDGKLIYATSEISGEIKKIDAETYKILGVGTLGDERAKPKDVLVSLDGKKLYVAGGRANSIAVLDADALVVLKKIPVGERVWGLAMNRDGSRLYTTDGVSHQTSVIDTASEKVIATVATGKFPWGVVVDD